ncbi:unnamed protein product [Prorocentrum cordatum]|uniref:Uncharacterized protein n=1 Tax=Prorocentrum cordatum TaxID=2364126 RepID=A0ABN9TEI7_9DINO|nr:unnamed protein product [Polarella glacialis]
MQRPAAAAASALALLLAALPSASGGLTHLRAKEPEAAVAMAAVEGDACPPDECPGAGTSGSTPSSARRRRPAGAPTLCASSTGVPSMSTSGRRSSAPAC